MVTQTKNPGCTCRAAVTPATEVSVPGDRGSSIKLTTDQSGPVPAVRIDNEQDAFSTIVCISYGDRLGELMDTVAFRSPYPPAISAYGFYTPSLHSLLMF